MSLVLVAAAGLAACNSPQPTGSAPSGSGTATASSQAAGTVARIVFVGQREACECTANRIAGTWKALETTLAGRKDLPVERIELDVDKDKFEQYEQLKPLMTAPGLYFLDAQGKLVKMLQGELTADQIGKAISPGSA